MCSPNRAKIIWGLTKELAISDTGSKILLIPINTNISRFLFILFFYCSWAQHSVNSSVVEGGENNSIFFCCCLMFKAFIKCLEDRGVFLLLTSSALISETSKNNLFEKLFLVCLLLFYQTNNLTFFLIFILCRFWRWANGSTWVTFSPFIPVKR